MTAQKPDPTRLAILAYRFDGIVRKMANTLLRTGRSGVLNRARDFSCCIVTRDGDLLSAAESLPIHVLSGPDLMARQMLAFEPDVRAGDAFLNNSPYHGCSHPADHTLLIPVVAGGHRFTVLVKAHQADIGNSVPTTYYTTARDVYEEGALIFPSVRVQRDYQDNADFIRMCEMRIRVPEQWRGDYAAMVGAGRIGERELLKLGEELGWDSLDAFAAAWLDYSEQRMIAALKTLPAGTVSHSSIHDPFPGTPPEGIAVKSIVTVDPAAARVTVNLSDNIDCVPLGLNLSEACARTSAMLGVFNSIDGDVPKNAGSFRRIDVRLRENCVVGIPRHPHSCSAATTNLADRVANGVQAAMAELGEGVGMAEYGAPIPATCPVVSGTDPRTGAAYVNQVFMGGTCGPGRPEADSWLTGLHVGNAGLGFIDSVELTELYHPMRVVSRALLPDSEGPGRTTGAPVLSVEYGPVGAPMMIAYAADGVVNPPRGVRGGGESGPSGQWLRHADGRLEALPPAAQMLLHPDQTLLAHCAGGGGYGPAADRPREKVLHDLAEGRISAARARDVYGLTGADTATG